MSKPIYVTFLNGPDIAELDLTDQEILDAIESSLAAQGRGEAVIEPRMHLKPNPDVHGHFNVLRGALGGPRGHRSHPGRQPGPLRRGREFATSPGRGRLRDSHQ